MGFGHAGAAHVIHYLQSRGDQGLCGAIPAVIATDAKHAARPDDLDHLAPAVRQDLVQHDRAIDDFIVVTDVIAFMVDDIVLGVENGQLLAVGGVGVGSTAGRTSVALMDEARGVLLGRVHHAVHVTLPLPRRSARRGPLVAALSDCLLGYRDYADQVTGKFVGLLKRNRVRSSQFKYLSHRDERLRPGEITSGQYLPDCWPDCCLQPYTNAAIASADSGFRMTCGTARPRIIRSSPACG